MEMEDIRRAAAEEASEMTTALNSLMANTSSERARRAIDSENRENEAGTR